MLFLLFLYIFRDDDFKEIQKIFEVIHIPNINRTDNVGSYSTNPALLHFIERLNKNNINNNNDHNMNSNNEDGSSNLI